MNKIDEIRHYLSQGNCRAVKIDASDKNSYSVSDWSMHKHPRPDWIRLTLDGYHWGIFSNDEITTVTPIITKLEPIEVGQRVLTDDGRGVVLDSARFDAFAKDYYVELFDCTKYRYQRHQLLTIGGES